MTTIFNRRVLVGLTLLSIASPLAVLADDDHHRRDNDGRNWRNNGDHTWSHDYERDRRNWNARNNWNRDNDRDNGTDNNRDNSRDNNRDNERDNRMAERFERRAEHAYDRAHWQTNYGNNWNDQREWYLHNMRNLQRHEANENQRRLEAEMRAQYLLYNNNNYNGPYGWDQYSDPRFLDYLHTRRPNLLSTIRSMVGI